MQFLLSPMIFCSQKYYFFLKLTHDEPKVFLFPEILILWRKLTWLIEWPLTALDSDQGWNHLLYFYFILIYKIHWLIDWNGAIKMPFPTSEINWKNIFVQSRNHLIQPDSLSDVGDSSEGLNCTWRSFTSSKNPSNEIIKFLLKIFFFKFHHQSIFLYMVLVVWH